LNHKVRPKVEEEDGCEWNIIFTCVIEEHGKICSTYDQINSNRQWTLTLITSRKLKKREMKWNEEMKEWYTWIDELWFWTTK